MRVKCEGMIFSFSAVASGCAVIGVVGVSSASTPASAAVALAQIVSRSRIRRR